MPTPELGEMRVVSLDQLPSQLTPPDERHIEFDDDWHAAMLQALIVFFAREVDAGSHVSSWSLDRENNAITVVLARPVVIPNS